MTIYKPTATYKVIYIYAIHDDDHKGLLKIGKADFDSRKGAAQLVPNCDELNQAARNRIDQQTHTAMVSYELLYTELALRSIEMEDGTVHQDVFEDKDVHKVLKSSGYRAVVFQESGKDSEWYQVDLDTAKAAIAAYKQGKSIITQQVHTASAPRKGIKLRKEQSDNVEKTMEIFKTQDTMLWDCKMRYGKTVTAYELIKREGFKRVIVITHRPAVEDSWDTDHDLMFAGMDHRFIDKSREALDGYDTAIDSKNDKVLSELVEGEVPFVYFASIQDLRGSKKAGGKHNKNNGVFDLDWELLIIDEAHEGTQTDLGENVIKNIRKANTKVLSLTGTAYGLLKDYGDNVFTWTYVDEQRAKREWAELHPDEKNPYEDLPNMNILTFDLGEAIENSYRYVTANQAFNFREFFRTWTGDVTRDFYPVPEGSQIGDFVHRDAVWSFLNLISKQDNSSNYPFSRPEYVDMFRHTFWLVPGVKEARALSALLRMHPFFSSYRVVNVAGDGDAEEQYDVALNKVRTAIKEKDRTITISCGRLTTGITVKEWTAVMVLSGSASTSVNGYMQTIFRVQSPGVIDGKRKEECYVFDFAPDRTLKVIGEVHKLSAKSGTGEEAQRAALGEFLNFCPVIAVEGTEMHFYDVPDLMRQIKRVSVDSAINSGFDDNTIYLSDAGLDRSDIDREILRKLSNVVAPKKRGQRETSVLLTQNGMTEEERRKADEAEKKERQNKRRGEKVPLTEEEKAALEKRKEEKKAQGKLFDLLRAVSIRLPLLFYGAEADITQIIHLKDFVTLVDDESWAEFMPTGLKKDLFLSIAKYYDEDVLVGAGLRIRRLAKAADEYPPTVRAARIVEIISKFKNPDKETVLTPWRVVNMQLGDTIGGYNFFTENYTKETDEPVLIDQGDVTAEILCNADVKILEMNSKSGLYPLYMAYTLYKFRLEGKETEEDLESLRAVWGEVLRENIFVLCKTKMARSITIRTLAGYTGMKVNAIYLTKLLNRMDNMQRLANKLVNPTTWEKEGEKMKFDAVVGNPPYQLEGGSGGTNDAPIYQHFVDLAKAVNPGYISLIIPARWFTTGRENLIGQFRQDMLTSKTVKKMVVYADSHDIFPTVEIKGGLCYFLLDPAYQGDCEYILVQAGIADSSVRSLDDFDILIRDAKLAEIVKKVMKGIKSNDETVASIISSDTPFGIPTNPFESAKMPIKAYREESAEHNTRLYFLENMERSIAYVSASSVIKNAQDITKCKVFIPKAGGSGNDPYVLGKPICAPENSICSQTFLYAAFGSENEALNFITYLQTKLFRILVSACKISQDAPSKVYRFVPLQDFSKPWSDSELYSKYGLSSDEIKYVEDTINPMSDEN